MEDSLRGPLIVLEVAALGVILAIVEPTFTRVALGLLIGLLLARNAFVGGASRRQSSGRGSEERRQDHLFRHWVNVLLKKIREFHTVCQGISDGGVNVAVGQLRLQEIEKELQDLIGQVTESAKPPQVRRRSTAAPRSERPPGSYGDVPEDR